MTESQRGGQGVGPDDINLTGRVRQPGSDTPAGSVQRILDLATSGSPGILEIRKRRPTPRPPGEPQEPEDLYYEQLFQNLQGRRKFIKGERVDDEWVGGIKGDWKEILLPEGLRASSTGIPHTPNEIANMGEILNKIRAFLANEKEHAELLASGEIDSIPNRTSMLESLDKSIHRISGYHPNSVAKALREHAVTDEDMDVIFARSEEIQAADYVLDNMDEFGSSSDKDFRDWVTVLDTTHTVSEESLVDAHNNVKEALFPISNLALEGKLRNYAELVRIRDEVSLIFIFGIRVPKGKNLDNSQPRLH